MMNKRHLLLLKAISTAYENRIVYLEAIIPFLSEGTICLPPSPLFLEHTLSSYFLRPHHVLYSFFSFLLIAFPFVTSLSLTLRLFIFTCQHQIRLAGKRRALQASTATGR